MKEIIKIAASCAVILYLAGCGYRYKTGTTSVPDSSILLYRYNTNYEYLCPAKDIDIYRPVRLRVQKKSIDSTHFYQSIGGNLNIFMPTRGIWNSEAESNETKPQIANIGFCHCKDSVVRLTPVVEGRLFPKDTRVSVSCLKRNTDFPLGYMDSVLNCKGLEIDSKNPTEFSPFSRFDVMDTFGLIVIYRPYKLNLRGSYVYKNYYKTAKTTEEIRYFSLRKRDTVVCTEHNGRWSRTFKTAYQGEGKIEVLGKEYNVYIINIIEFQQNTGTIVTTQYLEKESFVPLLSVKNYAGILIETEFVKSIESVLDCKYYRKE